VRLDLWDGAFSADVPVGWQVLELEDVIELRPPEPHGAAHVSVYRRTEQRAPEPGVASRLVSDFPPAQGKDLVPAEHAVPEGVAAVVSFTDDEPDGTTRWLVGARVSAKRAVVFSYNDDGSRDDFREAALALFDSVVVDG
jgi:hypothetical protein